MIHRRVKVYDERTGDPAIDNRSRRCNRAVNKACRTSFAVRTPRGRRRKHVITRIEYTRYCSLVAAVADEATA